MPDDPTEGLQEAAGALAHLTRRAALGVSPLTLKDKVDAATIKPFVQTVVREFGFSRLVFEANWFFCNFLPDGPGKGMDGYGTWATLLVPMLTELGATAEDLKQLFRSNALRAYGINTTRHV